MNTPRDLLLQRHASAEPELNALRQDVVRQLTSPPEPWWETAWREIIVAARPAWVGLATLALVAFALHLGSLERSPASPQAPSPSRASLEEAVHQRAQLWAELNEQPSGPPPTPPTNPSPKANPNRHRSEVSTQLWPV